MFIDGDLFLLEGRDGLGWALLGGSDVSAGEEGGDSLGLNL